MGYHRFLIYETYHDLYIISESFFWDYDIATEHDHDEEDDDDDGDDDDEQVPPNPDVAPYPTWHINLS